MIGFTVTGRYTRVREAVQAYFDGRWAFYVEERARAAQVAKERQESDAVGWYFYEPEEMLSRALYVSVMRMIESFEFMPPGERKEQGCRVEVVYQPGEMRVKVEPANVAD